VNNYVEKHPLDSREARPDAGYNKLPLVRAKIAPSKIKHLAGTSQVLVRKLR
jgi:hypothetical protein